MKISFMISIKKNDDKTYIHGKLEAQESLNKRQSYETAQTWPLC